ncbi:hypothetical protein A6770_17840 [Nostoc minutum NIES-26]|uniref:Uncharacterized protein n=1 Tax=Nostoc minutum NIES-26 TaxID=1844469 RepID=A0A367RDP5_9NOSO|nr:hypothetical protein A6770_17840 [Nostoc minutum NIES-26]
MVEYNGKKIEEAERTSVEKPVHSVARLEVTGVKVSVAEGRILKQFLFVPVFSLSALYFNTVQLRLKLLLGQSQFFERRRFYGEGVAVLDATC